MTGTWRPLKLGAGGYVTGIDMVGTTKVIRTDVGGAYVLNTGTGKWEQLCTSTRLSGAPTEPSSSAATGFDGVYEIKIAPSNSAIIYMVFQGKVWKSTDTGATFTATGFTQSNNLGANNGGIFVGDAFADRYNASKLAIDPIDPNVVYLGTKSAGVYKTVNGGTSWTQIVTGSIPFSSGTDFGHRVLVDASGSSVGTAPGHATDPTREGTVYASSRGNGVYRSTDGGVTWSLLASSPTDVINMKITHTGVLYTAGSDGHIRKYNGSWSDKSPPSDTGRWRNVITHPSDANSIIAVRDGGEIRVSSDAGDNYSAITTYPATRTATDIPWLQWTNEDYMSDADMIWDPNVAGRLWFAMGIGVWYADSISTSTTTISWTSVSADIEELVVNQIHKPSGGSIFAATWDRTLFKTSTPNTYPSTHLLDNSFGWGWSIDSAPADSNFLVVNSDKGSSPVDSTAKSTDGGANWTPIPALGISLGKSAGNYYGGHIAVSTSSNFVFAPVSASLATGAWYTINGGTSWTACTLPGSPGTTGWGNGANCKRRCVEADKVTANKFYLYNSATGFYRTTDGGATWTRVISNITFDGALTGGGATSFHAKLRAVPGKAGELFFTAGGDGQDANFIRSTDSGSTWAAVSTVTDVFAFGFGAAAPSGSYPAIYIAGKVSGNWGIWQSDDNCVSWDNIGTFPNGNFDFVTSMEGDPDTYGTVYMGFNGTGAAYYSLDATNTGTVTTRKVHRVKIRKTN